MTANLRVVQPNEAPELLPKRVVANEVNSARVAGNAKVIIARHPYRGRPLMRCVWCRQAIEPGSVYVKQDRWLRGGRGARNRWHAPGPRHRDCWEVES